MKKYQAGSKETWEKDDAMISRSPLPYLDDGPRDEKKDNKKDENISIKNNA